MKIRWLTLSGECLLLNSIQKQMADTLCALITSTPTTYIYLLPSLLTRARAINGLSLAFGIAGTMLISLALYRLSHPLLELFTLIAWLLSAMLLLVLILVYALCPSLQPQDMDNFIWSQSWYYAIISTILYFFMSFMLANSLWGGYVQDYYPPGLHRLTTSERLLTYYPIIYVIYLAGGAAFFSHFEGWPFLEGVYWADYTLLTIGMGGDIPPRTLVGKVVLIPFAFSGVIWVGLFTFGVYELVIERHKIRLGKVRQRLVSRIQTRVQNIRVSEIRRRIVLKEKNTSAEILMLNRTTMHKFLTSVLLPRNMGAGYGNGGKRCQESILPS